MSRLFGTNGIRGVVGQEMSPTLVLRVAKAIGTQMKGQPLAVGRDTRTSGPMLQAAAIAGLTAMGCPVTDVGVVPSPAIQYYVKTHEVQGGVIITASHNPREYNGVKVLDEAGMEASREVEAAIEATYFNQDFTPRSWEGVGAVHQETDAAVAYLAAVRHQVDQEAIRRAHLRVVVDCANGASCVTSPYLLGELGCQVVTLNAQPDGTFPGHPPEPREDHVGALQEAVSDLQADLGVVHDGDADRVLFVDDQGIFVPGDRSLALVAGDQVRKRPGEVVTPVSSSQCVEDVVRRAGGTVLYTKVGAPLVARTMWERDAVFGGEENGGLIFPQHQHCRDGAMGMAAMLDILAREERSLATLLEEVPRYYGQKSRFPCPDAQRAALMEAVRSRYESRRIEDLDGLKVHGEEGWVLIRPSGTEALIRVFSESTSPEGAERLSAEALAVLQEALEDLA